MGVYELMTFSKFFTTAFLSLLLCILSHSANALEYKTCISAKQSPICLIAFEKIQSIKNPISKKRYFHNGMHILENNNFFRFPLLYVATPDLDKDGTPEIIVAIPDETHEQEGLFCLPENQCPHFIIQDRALPDEKRTISTYKAMGPIYATSIALSTEVVSHSLFVTVSMFTLSIICSCCFRTLSK